MPDDVMMEAWIDDEAWDTTALLGEDAFHLGLRHALPPQYAGLTTEQLDAFAAEAMSRMTPEEAQAFEGWLSDLGNAVSKIGKAVAPVVRQVLPAAAPIVGTLIGGPAGAAIGQVLGGLAGQPAGVAPTPPAAPAVPGVLAQPAISLAPAAVTMPAPPAPAAATPAPGAPAAPAAASSAIAQLMSFLQNPALLQSIARQLLGIAAPTTAPAVAQTAGAATAGAPTAGAQTVAPAGAESVLVPFGAMMNTLSVLAEQAAAEAADGYPEAWSPESTTYLMNGGGGLYYDPAVPEERAAAVLQRIHAQPVGAWGAAAAPDGVTTWLAQAGLLE
jgi:hypothetical protein